MVLGLLFLPAASTLAESVCYGSTANGALENGCKLPSKGPNFAACHGSTPEPFLAGHGFTAMSLKA